MLEFSTRRIQKARKQHKCNLCLDAIREGSIYIRETGKYDGDFFDECFHPICENIVAVCCYEEGWDEWDRYAIIEWLRDRYCRDCIHHGPVQDDCEHSVLTCPFMREKWRKPPKGEDDD